MHYENYLTIQAGYTHHFKGSAQYSVRSPGRVNLIGEHTDYNMGPVLPFAIDLATSFAFATSKQSSTIRLVSKATGKSITFDVKSKIHQGADELGKILSGIVQETAYRGPGINIYTESSLPIGAGLSSSASFIVGLIYCFLIIIEENDRSLDEVAIMAQKIERDYLGVSCGLMDQVAICSGRKNKAILLETSNLHKTYISIPPQIEFVIIDSLTRRTLAHSDYNLRGTECKEASEHLGVEHLASIGWDDFAFRTNGVSANTIWYKRAQHVIGECQRVYQTAQYLQKGDLQSLGKIISDSHYSLSKLFEVSTPILDNIASYAQSFTYCLGARMMGAGFGGCVLALLHRGHLSDFSNHIRIKFPELACYPVNVADGASTALLS